MRRFVSAGFVVLAVLIGLALPAAASTSAVAAGTYTFVTTSTTSLGSAGGNTFLAEVLTVTYAGGVTGIATDTEVDVVHLDGSLNAYGTEVCPSCTIGGRTGSFVARYSLTVSVTGQVDGHLAFITGAGGLKGLKGEGSFTADTYAYRYHLRSGE